MGGYWGRAVRVDLTSGNVKNEEYNEEFYRTYLGGAGVLGYFLLKELKPGIVPLGPENKLIFAPGVITGVPLAGSGRNSVGAKSPMTGGFGKTEVGGYWGAALKREGIDVLIIEGQSPRPVYLWIADQKVLIKEAGHIWGLETREATNAIREELGETRLRTALIGPGGENMVRYACIMNDLNHAAGRTGTGAVMGSKKLKGIVLKGETQVPVEDPEKLKKLNKWAGTVYKDLLLHKIGTGNAMDAYNATGNLPTRNFRDGYFEDGSEIRPEAMMEALGAGMEGCYACPVRCKRMVQSNNRYKIDREYGGPEYEALGSFGSNCGINDIEAICAANQICNANSVDVISAGVTIGFAMECFEKGIIGLNDTGGIDLRFGNSDAMVRVMELIVKREGIGDLLAEGVARVSQEFGKESELLAVHCKGLELGMHEPRLKYGLGLGYAVASHGADHSVGIHDTLLTAKGANLDRIKAIGYLNPLRADDLSIKKVSLFADLQRWRNFEDSLVICFFVPYSMNMAIDILNSVTGWNSTVYEAMKIGERAIQLARVFNIREGFTKEQDILPPRAHSPMAKGALKGSFINKDDFFRARSLYYEEMRWDREGLPTEIALERLNIDWAAEYLK